MGLGPSWLPPRGSHPAAEPAALWARVTSVLPCHLRSPMAEQSRTARNADMPAGIDFMEHAALRQTNARTCSQPLWDSSAVTADVLSRPSWATHRGNRNETREAGPEIHTCVPAPGPAKINMDLWKHRVRSERLEMSKLSLSFKKQPLHLLPLQHAKYY